MHEAHRIGVGTNSRPTITGPTAPTEMWVTCTCGWRGPARHVNDRWTTGLLDDDRDWHDEKIASGPR